jgi:chaperone required for assembly of F1-ATPase
MSSGGPTKDGNGKDRDKQGPVIKDSLRKPLPKRFYKEAMVAPRAGGFAVLLDGRGVKTPAKRDLVLPTQALADAVAAEWAAQGTHVDPDTMPLTRIANSAIDAVADRMPEVRADIAAFAASDLLCYRATSPAGLVAAQTKHWNPVLDWARDDLGARFVLGDGIVHVAQPKGAIDAFEKAIAPLDPFRLAALHVMTTLTGSALLALACARGRISVEEAWRAAHVDEDWQIAHWGEDHEAAERRKRRRADFEAAARLIALLGGAAAP